MKSKLRKVLLISLFVICISSVFALTGCGQSETSGESETGKKFYTVTFDLCTDLQTTTALPKKVTAGSRIDEPKVYVTGDNPENYEIEGWYESKNYDEDSKWDFYFDSVQSDMTLYAKWGFHKQYKVNYYKAGDEEATYVATIEQGLTASECDDRFGGYEVLGYYSSPTFDEKFDFEAPIHADTNIYVKLSDYIYFSPKYLSGFETKNNASYAMTADGKSVEITYDSENSFIFLKGLNFALNDRELIEIVYKLEGGVRTDMYWFASDSSGNPVAGYSDFQEITKSIGDKSYYTEITTDEEGWTHAVYDLTRPRGYVDGNISKLTDIAVLNGIRFDVSGGNFPAKLTVKYVKGQKKPEIVGHHVEFYVGGELKETVGVNDGEKVEKPADEKLISGRQITGYYTDEGFTNEFDFDAPITETTKLYAKLSDYLYFNGAMLDGFSPLSGASKTLNEDGTLTIKGANGAFIHKKGLNVALNGGNCIEIKAKVDIKLGGRVDIYVFGTYTENGTEKESTDYGQANTRYRGMTTQGWSVGEPDENGYVVMRYDLAYTVLNEGAKDIRYNAIKGFRIDFIGGNEENNMVIEYVKSAEGSKIPEPTEYAVKYYVGEEMKHSETVREGNKPSPVSDELFTVSGKVVGGYYKDVSFTEKFDFDSPITADTNVYVRLLSVYSVDFYVGAELKHSESVVEGEKTPRVSDKLFVEEGRTVLGYYSDEAFTVEFDFDAPIVANVGVYVKLSEKVYPVYSVEFYVGTEIKYIEKVTEGKNLTEVSNDKFEEGGRKVLGYYKDADFTEQFDMNAAITADTKVYVKLSEVFTVNYYNGDELIYGEVVSKGDLPLGVPEEKLFVFGRETLGFYADKAFGEEFDFNAAVTCDADVYIKTSDYLYFNGKALDKFSPVAGATKTPNEDGTFTFGGTNGAWMYIKGLNIAINGGNYIEIKAKSDIKLGGFFDFYIYGEYTKDGVAAESTDFGQANTRYRGRTEDGCVIGDADVNGCRIYSFRLSDPINATGKIEYKTIKGFRIGLNGGNEENTFTIEYIKTVRLVSVKYYLGSELIKTEGLVAGDRIKTFAKENMVFGREIVGVYTDEALTSAFDPTTPITKDEKLYVRTSDYLYFNGAMLDGFSPLGGASKTLNEDGTLTVKGTNGAFIHKKGLNVALNGGNCIEIKAKVDIKLGGRVDIYVFGTYTENGTEKESTDYGQANTRYRGMTTQGWSVGEPDENGYVVMRYDLAYTVLNEGAKDIRYNAIKGFRIDFVGGNEENNMVIEYVKSVNVE